MSYRIIIDHSACSGFGSCADTAPHLFTLGGDGIATAPSNTADLDSALTAARGCPMGAIAILDSSGKDLQ